jgi:hypothetical protein
MKPFKLWDPIRGADRPDLASQHDELPVRGLVAVKRDRVSDMHNKLDELGWAPDMSGALLGRNRPQAFSRLYGPIGMQTPRRDDTAEGFLLSAPLVEPNTFILPTTTNILTGRNTTFFLRGMHAVSYVSWTYTTAGGGRPYTPLTAGSFYDSVLENNGGAQLLLNNSGFSFSSADSYVSGTNAPGKPKLCFEVELYDKRRGRLLHDGRLPAEMLASGAYAIKSLGGPVRIDPDTEIEPRVYITECRMNEYLDLTSNYSVASVACWLNISMHGHAASEVNE